MFKVWGYVWPITALKSRSIPPHRFNQPRHNTAFQLCSNRGDTCPENVYQKLAVNRTQLYSVQVSNCTRNFKTQPTNQTTRIWSRASVRVSDTRFLSVCHWHNNTAAQSLDRETLRCVCVSANWTVHLCVLMTAYNVVHIKPLYSSDNLPSQRFSTGGPWPRGFHWGATSKAWVGFPRSPLDSN